MRRTALRVLRRQLCLLLARSPPESLCSPSDTRLTCKPDVVMYYSQLVQLYNRVQMYSSTRQNSCLNKECLPLLISRVKCSASVPLLSFSCITQTASRSRGQLASRLCFKSSKPCGRASAQRWSSQRPRRAQRTTIPRDLRPNELQRVAAPCYKLRRRRGDAFLHR